MALKLHVASSMALLGTCRIHGTITALYRATLQLLHHMTICFGTIHPNTLPFHAFFHKGYREVLENEKSKLACG
ncbi:hypothetical protein CY35_08G072600 [Sphagnum magellanicum]|nr:hypothetical protein CY35_08G072600 [Sphagnum magellanicum]